MAAPDIANTWDNIRRGVKDAELLIGQKKYNFSMIKSRQVLELMVSYLCDSAGIESEDLASSIDALYDSEWITKTTCEHYHKIRMLGNKAVHEGNDNGYDANQSYHLLSQEVYTFANDYKSKKSPSRPPRGGRGQAPGGQGSRNGKSRPSGGSGSSRSGAPGRSGSQRSRSGSRNSRSRRRQPSSGFFISPVDLVRLGLVLVVILVIFLAVRLVGSKKESDTPETSSTPAQTIAPPSLPETSAPTLPVETMADTTPAPVYKTTATLNVRSEPSTAGQILGKLDNGTIIDYVEDYDDEWVIINYNGTEAYVSSQYLVHD